MNNIYHSLSIAGTFDRKLNIGQKFGLSLVGLGLFMLLVALTNGFESGQTLILSLSLSGILFGTALYAWQTYKNIPAGIQNNGLWFFGESSRGILAWILAVVLTAFYVALYWFDSSLEGVIRLFDPLSMALEGKPASQWFVYGSLYTIAILGMGFKFIMKYRHNNYQIIRTLSVMFFQLGFAFLLPEILMKLNNPYYNFANMWPLNYYFFDEWSLKGFLNGGSIGMFMLAFGMAMIFLISPILTYFFGKRWYCSWVCGCGGLAETAGDPFRHLSDSSLKAWKLERWIIHFIMVVIGWVTIAVIYSFFRNNPDGYWFSKETFIYGMMAMIVLGGVLIYVKGRRAKTLGKDTLFLMLALLTLTLAVLGINFFSDAEHILFVNSQKMRSAYGFFIGSAFSGVIGVGFYPLLGSRVWCRFGCPMAGLLGLQQRFFSRFRITTNGNQCISCGNCTTHCEMGIDVRAYAQREQNIVRASCVGCGICSAVCPRGVLRLENGPNTGENRTFVN